MTSISVAEYRKKYGGGSQPAAKAIKAMKNKFNAVKVKIDGLNFDSKKEAKHYIQLKAMQQLKEIHELKHHQCFELAPKVKIEGEKRAKPALRYFADFTYYTTAGEFVVEDVKSAITRKTASYRNKKHLMKTVLNIDIQEV